MKLKNVNPKILMFWLSLAHLIGPGFFIFLALFILLPIGYANISNMGISTYLIENLKDNNYLGDLISKHYVIEARNTINAGYSLLAIGLFFSIIISSINLVILLKTKTYKYFMFKLIIVIFMSMFYIPLFTWIGNILTLVFSLLSLKNEPTLKKELVKKEEFKKEEDNETL